MNLKEFFHPTVKKIILMVLLFVVWLFIIPFLIPQFAIFGGQPPIFDSIITAILETILIAISLPTIIFHYPFMACCVLIRWDPIITPIFIFPLALIWDYFLACVIFRKKK